MATAYHRVVTGHTPQGKSTVLFDSSMPLVEQAKGAGGDAEVDRHGAASSVAWTTQGFPAQSNDSSEAGLRNVTTALSDGTVLRIVQYAPGVTPRHHRTDPIDYAAVLSGSIELELDTETVKLNPGDILVQRGTVHNWINNGTEPCIMFHALIGADAVSLKSGMTLPPQG